MEAIFNLFKVKFKKLDEILTRDCPNIKEDSTINIFINIESVIRKLASTNVEQYLQVKSDEKTLEMVSCIVNLAMHYRLFFTKNKLYSRVFLYMNYPLSKNYYKNRSINPDYRTYYEHKLTANPKYFTLGKTISDAIPFAKIILEYVEDVYMLQVDGIESSVVPQLITSECIPDNSVNIIVSSDSYDYQYANKDFYIIRPKQNESYVVNKNNLMDILKNEEKYSKDLKLDSRYYSFIISLLGDRYRNISKLKKIGLATIDKMISKGIEEGIIGKDVFNINILSNIIKQEYRQEVLNNFYCTDIDTQFSMLNFTDKSSISSQLINKFDNLSLKKLNDDYFKNYPLYLVELMGASKYKKK